MLESLYSHFKLVQLTSFEELSQDNPEQAGTKELISKSTTDLKELRKELDSQRVDKDDLRFEIFTHIYEILADNISLRLSCNRQLETILLLNTKRI